MSALKDFVVFLGRSVSLATKGDWRYFAWTGLLFAVCLLGLHSYARQFVHGLAITGMSDQVSWGVYIANFTFLVGVAAAAVMLVIPVYIYKNEEMHDLVIFGELLAIAAILMCLAFVTVDLGRPDRFWHLIPGVGKFNFPGSMLSWDVIVLNGYLVLNVYICAYLLFCRYRKKSPVAWLYLPVVFLAIIWAVSIHTVTAFLYAGLGGRPFWNSSIIGPRFIASAFTAGPALIILALQLIRRLTAVPIGAEAPPGPDGEPVAEPPRSRPATLEDFAALGRHLPELQSVPDEILRASLEGAVILDVEAGQAILRQGKKEREAYFVLEGLVVVKRQEGERLRIIRSVGPGEQFGEISALTAIPRTATALAEENSRLLRLPAESLRKLMQNHALHHIIHLRMSERLMITDRALFTLRRIAQVAMLINVFLLLNEVFKEFYTGDLHVAASQYLYFGLHGHHGLVPWIWTAVACNLAGLTLLLLPASQSLKWLNAACLLVITGIWIEKGMGLVVPGFVPTPLGEIVEYSPSWDETLICLGIWAFGLLCYTIMLRVAVPILQGRFTRGQAVATGS